MHGGTDNRKTGESESWRISWCGFCLVAGFVGSLVLIARTEAEEWFSQKRLVEVFACQLEDDGRTGRAEE